MVLIVLPWLPMFPPYGSCFQSVGPQGIVKYLSKYAVIFEVDDVAFDGWEDKLNKEDKLYCYESTY